MKLFICTTPMQLFLACRIIEEMNLSASKVQIFYISTVNNKVVANNLEHARIFSHKVSHLIISSKFSRFSNLYFILIYKMFFFKKYNSIYVASIDNIYVHFILTYTKFNKLFTFDDGTANIFNESTYYVGDKYRSNLYRTWNKVRYGMLRIPYSMSKVKKESLLHYSIYDNFPNIIDNVYHINLLKNNNDIIINKGICSRKKSCNIMLGGAYFDLFGSEDKIKLYTGRCFDYLKNTNEPNYYIPHPRNLFAIETHGINIINTDNIAELEISKLLEEYDTIKLYGFMSSCQFNILSNNRVINHCFYTKEMNKVYKATMENSFYAESFKVISID